MPCIVFEALAAFHIQFCDGEDLMMLYVGAPDLFHLCFLHWALVAQLGHFRLSLSLCETCLGTSVASALFESR